MLRRRVLKRPAKSGGRSQGETPVEYEPSEDAPLVAPTSHVAASVYALDDTEPSHASMAASPSIAAPSEWASRLVDMLIQQQHLIKPRRAIEMELSVWSDCCSIGCFALEEIRAVLRKNVGLQISFRCYCACENDPAALAFVEMNHKPLHTSTMTRRNFGEGKFFCNTHQVNHPLPKVGLDVYIGTFPCSPMSRRGRRAGFVDAEAKLLLIGLQTIVATAPTIWVLELGEMQCQSARDEAIQKIRLEMSKSQVPYVIETAQHLQPFALGYPMMRSRFFVLGCRQDVAPGRSPELTALQCLVGASPPQTSSYIAFLGLRRSLDWSRVGQYPEHATCTRLASTDCACGLDPMVLCQAHPCRCRNCGKDLKSCAWRRRLQRWLSSLDLQGVVRAHAGTLTYLQVLELQGGRGPTSPRERTLVNILATQNLAQPLNDTLMIADLSLNPPFDTALFNGYVPTLTPTSDLWSFQAGSRLSACALGQLMGLSMDRVLVTPEMHEQWFRKRLGQAVHVPTFGMVLLAALAAPLHNSLCSSE